MNLTKIFRFDKIVFAHDEIPLKYRSIFAIVLAKTKEEAFTLVRLQEGDQDDYSIVEMNDFYAYLDLIHLDDKEIESGIEYWLSISNDQKWIDRLK